MSESIYDIMLFSKTIVDSQPWLHDPRCLPIPWRRVEKKSKLKIGVMWNDGIVLPTPPVSRALLFTVEKLKSQGHEVVDWKPELHPQALKVMQAMFLADGGKSVRKALGPVGEPFRPEMSPYEKATELGVYDMWQLQLERTGICKAYMDQWNAVGGLDAILCQCGPRADAFSASADSKRSDNALRLM